MLNFRLHLIFTNLTDSRICAKIKCLRNLSVLQYPDVLCHIIRDLKALAPAVLSETLTTVWAKALEVTYP